MSKVNSSCLKWRIKASVSRISNANWHVAVIPILAKSFKNHRSFEQSRLNQMNRYVIWSNVITANNCKNYVLGLSILEHWSAIVALERWLSAAGIQRIKKISGFAHGPRTTFSSIDSTCSSYYKVTMSKVCTAHIVPEVFCAKSWQSQREGYLSFLLDLYATATHNTGRKDRTRDIPWSGTWLWPLRYRSAAFYEAQRAMDGMLVTLWLQ